MHKISDKVIRFITEGMKNWKVVLAAGVKTLAEVKIQRGIFLGDVFSPLPLVIAMMPLNYILRKFTEGYKFAQSQEKINHYMHMDDIKLLTKKWKELKILMKTVRIYSRIKEWNLV